MSYEGKFVSFYDKIFAKKDYQEEIDFIRNVYNSNGKKNLKKVLDFGCGTGTHSSILSKEVKAEILAYDTSKQMIDSAIQKHGNTENCTFTCDKQKLNFFAQEFDLAISMFYVVNHIQDLDTLQEYFQTIANLLAPNGLLIFDCWNGVAALRDPPAFSKRERYSDDQIKIVTSCDPKIDFLNSFVTMENDVTIFKNNRLSEQFTYHLEHRLWTPSILKQLAEINGLEVLKIVEPYNLENLADPEDYKLAFVCRRTEEK